MYDLAQNFKMKITQYVSDIFWKKLIIIYPQKNPHLIVFDLQLIPQF
jgi:hypothetical protein